MNWPDAPELYGLLDRYEERWKLTYPDLNITREVMRAAEWCEANPSKRPKKNWKRFMTTWLAKNQRIYELTVAREAWQREQQRADAMVGRNRA